MLGIMPVRKYLEWLMAGADKNRGHNVYIPTNNAYDLMSLANQLKFDSNYYTVDMHFAFDDESTADLTLKVRCIKSGTYFGFRLKKMSIGQKSVNMGQGENNKILGSRFISKADSHIIRKAMPEFCRHIMPDVPYSSRDMEVCMYLSNMYYTASVNQFIER